MHELPLILSLFVAVASLLYVAHKKRFFKVAYRRIMMILLIITIPPTFLIALAVVDFFPLWVQCISGALALTWLLVGFLYFVSLTNDMRQQ
jgi:hypothetical protein